MKINIAFSTNRKFLPLLLAAITSILRNTNKKHSISIFVLHSDLTLYDIESVRTLKNLRDFDIQFMHINPKLFKGFPTVWTTRETWYRCILADTLPSIDKILYLDTDIIVRGDIAELFQINMHESLVAGVEDVSDSKNNKDIIKISDFYFNAGVLLLNLAQWRKQHFFAKIRSYVKHNKTFQADQGTLNKLTDGNKILLDPKYNFMHVWWRENNCQYDNEYNKLYKTCDPVIVHFTGTKPLKAECHNKFKNEFDIYFDQAIQTINLHMAPVPVILSADDNYAPEMYVTMLSMLQNKNTNTFYDYYLMIPDKFSRSNSQSIKKLAYNYCCNINFIKMKNSFNDCKMRIKHITTPTYYRLLAADYLPQIYSKCLYLDVDICVLHDLSELFNIDIKKHYVAGVPAISYYFNNESTTQRLHIPTAKKYINAGVLVMNLEQIRKDKLTEKFIELSRKNYASQDQDVLNVACFGRITVIPLKYNLMTKYDFTHIPPAQSDTFNCVYGKQNIDEALSNPTIIHYADKIKPWNNKKSRYAEYWWKYANQSPYSRRFKVRHYLKRLFG